MSVRKILGLLLAVAAICLLTFTGCLLIRVAGMHSPPPGPEDDMHGFDSFSFALSGPGFHRDIRVYYSPKQGPPVLLLHELPGMTSACVCFARRLAAARFTVYMPLLFGKAGGLPLKTREILKICRSAEISCYRNRPSPAAEALVPLVDTIQQRDWTKDTPVGAIGMCLTGNFPLVLIQHGCVRAAVLSQPATPLPLLPGEAKTLAITGPQLDRAHANKAAIMVFRFTTDPIAPEERLGTLKRSFPEQIQIYPVFALDKSHSVFADGYKPNLPETATAERHLVEFLHAQLDAGTTTPPCSGAPHAPAGAS